MAISDKIKKNMVAGSWIRRMFEEGIALKKQYGNDKVYDLSLGNPIIEPPEQFNQELKKLVNNPLAGMHRYMENAGYADTRAAVAAQLTSDTGIKFTQNEIVMTCGAAGALNIVLKTILNPGDEVILFAPYFLEYDNYIDNFGGIARILPTDENFLPRLDILENSINKKTKALIINSPNNPTGVVYGDKFLRQLGEVLQRKEAEYGIQIYLISDEPYRNIIYDGMKFPQVLLHHPQCIVLTSHSKDLALPGERIGYAAVRPDCFHVKELVDGFIFCNRILGFVNAPALMQRVVKNLQGVTVPIDGYQKKRDLLYNTLTGMGYSLVKPQGAFYMFPKSPIPDDVAFVRELQQQMVLTVPGAGSVLRVILD